METARHEATSNSRPGWFEPVVLGVGIFIVLIIGTVVVSLAGWLSTWWGQVLAALVSVGLAAAGGLLYRNWRDGQLDVSEEAE